MDSQPQVESSTGIYGGKIHVSEDPHSWKSCCSRVSCICFLSQQLSKIQLFKDHIFKKNVAWCTINSELPQASSPVVSHGEYGNSNINCFESLRRNILFSGNRLLFNKLNKFIILSSLFNTQGSSLFFSWLWIYSYTLNGEDMFQEMHH